MVDPEAVIAQAVRTERETALFYRMLAEIVEGEEVCGKLLELAEAEESHATSLCGIYQALTGRRITPGAASPEGGMDLFQVSSRSLEEVLEVAIESERKAAQLYGEQADRVDDPSTETTLRLLAADELHHAEFLATELERLRG